jgi:site-specific recombinase XerD
VPRKPGVKSARFTSRSGATEARSSSRAEKSSNQQGMAVLRVQQIFKRYAREAGLPHPVASHSLRHSCAVPTFSLEYVADLLGHRSIRSTQVYAPITSPAREQMLRQLAQSGFVVRWIC